MVRIPSTPPDSEGEHASEAASRASQPILFRVRAFPIEAFGDKHGRQTRKFLLMDITSYADVNGDNCYPGVSRLAKDCGLHQRSIQRNIAWLRDHGFVEVAIKAGPNQSNVYTIMIPEVVTSGSRDDIQPSSRREPHGVMTSSRQEGGDGKRTGGDIQSSPNHPYTNQLPNKGPTKKRAPKDSAPPFVLPDWISVEVWNAFEEMRKKIRRPMTNHARELIVLELAKLRDTGNPPIEVLNQSIRKSWQDVFPLKQDQRSGKPPASQKIDYAASFGLTTPSQRKIQ